MADDISLQKKGIRMLTLEELLTTPEARARYEKTWSALRVRHLLRSARQARAYARGETTKGFVVHDPKKEEARTRAEIHRVAEPPSDLDWFESGVMSAHAALMIEVDRAFLRELLRYVRRLEHDVEDLGGFW